MEIKVEDFEKEFEKSLKHFQKLQTTPMKFL